MMRKCILAVLLAGACYSESDAITLPTLPQATVNTTMPAITGTTYTVSACNTLQSTLDTAAAASASLNHAININVGLTCTGPYVLPAHNSGSGWIVIRSSNYASLPAEGTRISTSDATNMPTIKYGQASENAAIYAASNAQRYRFVGINFTDNNSYTVNYAFIQTGRGGSGGTNTGYFVFDRVLFRPTSNIPTGRAIYADADVGNVAIIDSYCSGVYGTTSLIGDTQCFLFISNAGPILIRNNYLSAAGENVMFCGGEPFNINVNQQYMPKDITIQRNLFEKETSTWNTDNGYTVKTLFETKCGNRILVEGNIFQNQTGYQGDVAFRLTPRNEYVNPSYIEVSDLTIRHNIVRNVANWINAIASDDGSVDPGTFPTSGSYSNHSKRWAIHNNLVYGLGNTCYPSTNCGSVMSIAFGGSGSNCYDYVTTCKMEDLSFFHNTIDKVTQRWFCVMSAGEVNLDYRDNLINNNSSNGIYNCDSNTDGIGTAALNVWYGGTWTMTNNTVAAVTSSGSYPSGGSTNSYPASYTSIQWVTPCTATPPCTGTYDYSLQAGSPAKSSASDGADRGVDLAALNAAHSGSGGSSTGGSMDVKKQSRDLIFVRGR